MIDLYERSTWTDWQGLPVMIRRYEIGFCSLETAIREMKRLANGQDPDQLARQKNKESLASPCSGPFLNTAPSRVCICLSDFIALDACSRPYIGPVCHPYGAGFAMLSAIARELSTSELQSMIMLSASRWQASLTSKKRGFVFSILLIIIIMMLSVTAVIGGVPNRILYHLDAPLRSRIRIEGSDGPNPSIMVFQHFHLYDDRLRELFEASEASHRRYASVHNYAYRKDTGNYIQDGAPGTGYMNKVYALLGAVLDELSKREPVQWIM
jgi:hypothetical protein